MTPIEWAHIAFVGGAGTILGQLFRRNYPNYSAGLSLNIPFRNRAAQGDYVDDLLTLRQRELQYQKATNDVRVQVKNAVISLQQARARYENAVATRKFAQQTLEAEQSRFNMHGRTDRAWSCDDCGYKFVTPIRLVDEREPAIG